MIWGRDGLGTGVSAWDADSVLSLIKLDWLTLCCVFLTCAACLYFCRANIHCRRNTLGKMTTSRDGDAVEERPSVSHEGGKIPEEHLEDAHQGQIITAVGEEDGKLNKETILACIVRSLPDSIPATRLTRSRPLPVRSTPT